MSLSTFHCKSLCLNHERGEDQRLAEGSWKEMTLVFRDGYDVEIQGGQWE